MKKLISFITVFTMLACLFTGVSVNAAAGNLTITATPSASTIQSDSSTPITVAISVSGVTDAAPLGPTKIILTYDNTKFTVKNGVNNGTGGAGKPEFARGPVITNAVNNLFAGVSIMSDVTTAGSTNTLSVLFDTDTPIGATYGNGVLGTFTFTPKAPVAAGNTTFAFVISSTDTNSSDGDSTAPVAHNITGVNAVIDVQGATPTTYTLTKDTMTNGDLTFNPASGPYTAGSTVTVTAAPAAGYRLVAFTGASTSTTSPVTITMDGNKTIGATFEAIPPTTYTLTKDTMTNGDLTFSPASGPYTAGSTVTVTAVPANGYHFVAFTGASTSTTNPVTITMDGNKTIGATFAQNPVGAAIAIGSITTGVHANSVITVNVTGSSLETAKGVQFDLTYNDATFTEVSVTPGPKLTENGSTYGTGTLTFIGLVTDGQTIGATDVIATVSLKVKSTITTANETLTIANPVYGTGAAGGSTAIANITNGTINITVATDPNLPAAQAAVLAYETGSLTTLTEVATAEGKKAAAVAAVNALDPVLSATDIISLNGKIATRDGVIAAARAELEKQAAAETAVAAYQTGSLTTLAEVATAESKLAAAETAVAAVTDATAKDAFTARITARTAAIAAAKETLLISTVNSGNFTVNHLGDLGINGKDQKDIAIYKFAVAVAKKYKNGDLLKSEIQTAISDANSVQDADLGYVDDKAGIDVNDVVMIKDFFLNHNKLTVIQAVKGDTDKNGVINADDISDIIAKALNQ